MPPPTELPPQVTAAYRGWSVVRLSRFEHASVVWRLESAEGAVRYAKVGWCGRHPSMADERARLDWCAGKLPVPEVVDAGTDERVEWLVTVALPGIDATDDGLRAEPQTLVPKLGAALRVFHESVAVDGCPFDFRLDAALEHCTRRVHEGSVPLDELHPEWRDRGPEGILDVLVGSRPPTEDVVVCHGDYCFPNVLLADGRVTGYLDLGALGVADRWRDIAIGAWSTTWNVDPSHEPLFYEGYGVEPDPDRIRYYRMLYDLSS
jgi:kanamycin kinase